MVPGIAKGQATGGAVAVGTATEAVGAGIGATIGALAIGITTFGVAAGAGLVLGGAIGGLVVWLQVGEVLEYY